VDRATDRPRGFAFVEFSDSDLVSKAIQELDGVELGGRTLRVSEARERAPRPPFGGGGWGNRTPGSYFEPGEIRQWQREFQERLGDAQDIRRMLQQEGFSAEELNEIIQRMQEFDDSRVYQSIEVLAGLQTMILEELKRFEYRLRREVDAESEELFLAASDDVPPGFRDLIEEYYRALSREN